ncbi:hypothetical protein XENOCAPTIV_029875 [Xenoophorus captivus]|uniref:Uncharacterized protein n=1 Tax=Xenoophorus captivus TaxID=1517983 RepID=A0ABV0RMW1_9TELE
MRKLTKYNFQVSPEFLISVSAAQKPPEQRPPSRSHSPGRPPIQTVYQPVHIPVYIQAKPTWHPQQGQSSGFSRPQLSKIHLDLIQCKSGVSLQYFGKSHVSCATKEEKEVCTLFQSKARSHQVHKEDRSLVGRDPILLRKTSQKAIRHQGNRPGITHILKKNK